MPKDAGSICAVQCGRVGPLRHAIAFTAALGPTSAVAAAAADAFQESLATLRFADRARNIANRAVVNSAHDTDTILAIKASKAQRLCLKFVTCQL
jgi:hypothetical protein